MRKTSNIVGHYVPKFYLDHWCDENGHFWVHPLDGRKPFKGKPSKFAKKHAIYDTSSVEGLEDLDTEFDLSLVEGLFAEVWPNIFERSSDPDTKRNLSRFVAQMLLRHPSLANYNRNEYFRLKRELEAMGLGPDDKFTVPFLAGEKEVTMTEFFRLGEDTEQHLQSLFIEQLRTDVETISQIFFDRTWGVVVSDDPVFVTGDFPIVKSRGTSEKESFGYGTIGTEVVFPLSPTKLLLMSDDFDTNGLIYPLEEMGDLNHRIVNASDRFVFSATKEIVSGC